MKKYYIGGAVTLVTIVFAFVTLTVNRNVINYHGLLDSCAEEIY